MTSLTLNFALKSAEKKGMKKKLSYSFLFNLRQRRGLSNGRPSIRWSVLLSFLLSFLLSCAEESRRNDGRERGGSFDPVVLASTALGQGGDKDILCNLIADKTFRGYVFLKPDLPDEDKQCIHIDIQKAPKALLEKDSHLFFQIHPISLDEEELVYGPALVFSAVKKESALESEEEVSLSEKEEEVAEADSSHRGDTELLSEDIDLTQIGEDESIYLLSENIDPDLLVEGEIPPSELDPDEYEGPFSSTENMFLQSKIFDHTFATVEMNAEAESFFEDHNLKICDIEEEQEALLIMVYVKDKEDKKAEPTPVRASHFLIPPFLTNPWDFRSQKGEELARFHPLAYLPEEAPEEDYREAPKNLCHQEL